MRSEFVIKNSIWGIVSQGCNIIFGFIGRTVFIYTLGGDYLGISSLFTNILNILSLSELGFSTAVAYNLYKPLAEKNQKKIAAIMNFYKNIYRVVAVVILILGLIATPFLKYLIKESPFDIRFLQFVYFLYLIKTVTSYLFSYKFTLATADQRNYLIVNIDSIARIILTIINSIALIITHDYIIYLFIDIGSSIILNGVKSFVITKKYPLLTFKYRLDKGEKIKIFDDVKNIFASKISTVIVSSTDNIIISAFISTLAVGIYDNYNMLINYINGFLTQFTSSTQASLGNVFVAETDEYIINCIKRMMFIIFVPLSICCTCLFCSLNTFIYLWLGKAFVETQYFVAIMMINFFVQSIKVPLWQGVAVSGMFKNDKNIAVLGAVSNLIISIILVKPFGISGVIVGTIISQLLQLVFKAQLLYKKYLCKSASSYYYMLIKYTLILCIQLLISYSIKTYFLNSYTFITIVLNCIINTIICISIIILCFWGKDEMRYTLTLLHNILRKVFKHE